MSLATTTVFLYIGFDSELRKPGAELPENPGGFMGTIDWLEMMAGHLEQLYDAEFADLELPVVFDYEITEELGAWLFHHPDATECDFSTEARRMVAECMGEAA